jgi:hypothetical protein
MTTGRASFWKAALIAPWGVPLAINLAIGWEAVSNFGLSGLSDLPATILLVFLFGLPISYGAMLLLGLPYLMWLRSKGWLNWIFVCVGATVLGSAIWSGYWQLSLHPPSLMRTIPVGAFAGLFVGVIFSLVAKLPR